MKETIRKLTEAIKYHLTTARAYREFPCPGRPRHPENDVSQRPQEESFGRSPASFVLANAGRFQCPSETFVEEALSSLTVPAFGRFRVFPFGISVTALPPSEHPPLTFMDIAELIEGHIAHTGSVADIMWFLSTDADTLPPDIVILAPMHPIRTHHDGSNPTYLFERIARTDPSAPTAKWRITPFHRDLIIQDPRWPVPIVVFTHVCPGQMLPTNPRLS